MKTNLKIYAVLIFHFFISTYCGAQNVDQQNAYNVAMGFVSARAIKSNVDMTGMEISNKDTLQAWLFHTLPVGYIIITADTNLHPVYAYSFENGIDPADEHWKKWIDVISADMAARSATHDLLHPSEKSEISSEWRSLLNGESHNKLFQQWPPAGSTSTGGWLETNWTQNAPYNNMCPMDLNAGNRSLAGCPSVAMAQIVNLHKKINSTRFNNGDDYYHNYGSGNQYWIDNDSSFHDFPGFGTLNLYLDSIETFYLMKAIMSDDLKAALVFACGVAAKQVYAANGSGTFGIDQAADAFQRFGFADSRLVYPSDTNLNTDLADNIKNSLPAHLGVVNAGNTAGHNVVVDGYNTDGFYHFNFGWGGSYNGWYTMPPSTMPYSLNYIEGIVLDINADSAQSEISYHPAPAEIQLFPNPANELINIELPEKYSQSEISVRNIYGSLVLKNYFENADHTSIDVSHLSAGMYLINVKSKFEKPVIIKLIKH